MLKLHLNLGASILVFAILDAVRQHFSGVKVYLGAIKYELKKPDFQEVLMYLPVHLKLQGVSGVEHV